ncbi:hypothetical protein [Emticicia sp. C21]|uniref:hypothetical protein n=1 Tax=Emticicia sp. C21 TaxID=2302915 RepID=UPI000E3516DF|nr:hypothetical protein [Emticicia sp. C21]RFS17096.1 hypothetical protein D0T08_10505 [Emticicia sp. C21]
MKKLEAEPISISHILLFFTILFLCNCKEKPKSQKNGGEKIHLPAAIPLTKEEFFKCIKARDTVFADGDYLKYIPVESDHYEIEINMNGVIDTLDYYLTCQIYPGMMPKLLFRLNSDYIGLGHGSSSYRYLILCSFNNNEKSKKIDTNKFETAINLSTVNDGFIFKMMDAIYFYDLNKKVLLFKKLSNKFAKSKIKDSSLYENRANIVFEGGNELTYKIKDFQLYHAK